MEQQLTKAGGGGLSFFDKALQNVNDLEEIKKVGMMIIESGFCPDHFKGGRDGKPDPVGLMMCVAAGSKLGLDTLQSLINIVPIKGMPTLKGDLIRNLIQASGLCEVWEESYEGTYPNDDFAHVLRVRRRGRAEKTVKVSIADAKRWGLFISPEQLEKNKADIKAYWATPQAQRVGKAPGDLSKSGWARYPDRMLMYRNIGFVGRDVFGDVISDLPSYEERMDYENSVNTGNELNDDKPELTAKGTTARKPATVKKKEEQPPQPVVESPRILPGEEEIPEVEYEEVAPVPPVQPTPEPEPDYTLLPQPDAKILDMVTTNLGGDGDRGLHHMAALRAALVKNYPQKFPDIKSVAGVFENIGIPNGKEFLQKSSCRDISIALQKIIES